MADLAFLDQYTCIEAAGIVTTDSGGTAVTPNATADTKGSITEIIASTDLDADLVYVVFPNGQSNRDYLMDIMIGGSGSEVVLMADLHYRGGGGSKERTHTFKVPISIPGGSRLSARCQDGVGGSNDLEVAIYLFAGTFESLPPYSYLRAYGVSSASRGVTVDPGGTANTKGSWTEIAASTTNDHPGLIMSISQNGNNVLSQAFFLIDIAIGGSGSEQILIENWSYTHDAGESLRDNMCYIPISIPAGTRLAVRCQSTQIDATDRLIDVMFYGLE